MPTGDTVPLANGGTGATTAAAARTALGAVNKAGDTMTGNLVVAVTGAAATISADSSNSDAGILLDKGASGKSAFLQSYTNGVVRWQQDWGNSAAESGGNAGSDFAIHRFNDAGTFLSTALSIARNTGNVSISSSLSVTGSVTGSAGLISGAGVTAAGTIQTTGSFFTSTASNYHTTGGAFVTTDNVTFTTTVNSGGLTNTGASLSGSTYFRNILDTNPQGANNILSSQHQPGVIALWQMQVIGVPFSFKSSGRGEANVAWDVVSDRRTKTNIQPVTDIFERLRSMPVYTFERIDEPVSLAGPSRPTRHVGVLAQEVQVRNPELVTIAGTEELTDRLVVNYDPIGPLAAAGVVKLLERIEALEAKLEAHGIR